jgi:L-fuconolactonase
VAAEVRAHAVTTEEHPVIVDAHQHVWDLTRARYDWLGPAMAPINRTITEEEALPRLRSAGVDGAVLVQAADNREDTDYMLATAERHREVLAVVAYLPLEDPVAAEKQLAELVEQPLIVGIRNLIHDRADPDFLLRPDVNESLALIAAAGLTYDVVSVLPRHLEHVPVLAERHPELRMVIDHLSKPPIGGVDREPPDRSAWWSLIERAAQSPNVYAKVSGLYPGDDMTNWSTETIRPYVDHALECFGPSRLMYGGDWPVSILAGDYDAVWRGLRPLFDELAEPDRAAVLAGTAIEFYRIPDSRLAALD